MLLHDIVITRLSETSKPHGPSILSLASISLRCTRSWKNAGTSTPSRVRPSRSWRWASTCSGTVMNCKRKEESPCVSSAEGDGGRRRAEVKRSQLQCRIPTTPQKAAVSDSDGSEVPRCLWARQWPQKLKWILSTRWVGWAMKRLCLYEELAGLALAIPVDVTSKKKSISCLFSFVCMCKYLKCICVNMSKKFYNFIKGQI